MSRNKIFILLVAFILLVTGVFTFCKKKDSVNDKRFISYTVDINSKDLAFYWKDDSGKIIRSIKNLKNFVEGKNSKLLFAMNGGMFNNDNSPKGLFIQHQKKVVELDTSSGEGNFYLKPNGVFYITTDNRPFICRTNDFVDNGQLKFATQSGPMLVIDGEIHPAFRKGSVNLYIRNGVGVLPDNKVIFAMSKSEINFYDFAEYFKNLGCKNALYLDGFVSRAYLPEKNWSQTDGNFGVIIGISKPKNE
jgi:uncharacterized protein YigE (DUF2233 family)